MNLGDETEDIQWVAIVDATKMLRDDPSRFSWVDQTALELYLSKKGVY